MRWICVFFALLTGPAAAADWTSDKLCVDGVLAPSVRLQLQRGTVQCDQDELLFKAGPRTSTVGKAALIVPFDPLHAGARVTVRAELYLPPESPANSIILVDIECKWCGMPGNPGLRLYLRDAGLRIDRKKIGERHAWAVPNPERLGSGEWVELVWILKLGDKAAGRSQVWLNGTPVLGNKGRTLPFDAPDAAVDRVQIGITANSNQVPVTLKMRNIRIVAE